MYVPYIIHLTPLLMPPEMPAREPWNHRGHQKKPLSPAQLKARKKNKRARQARRKNRR